MKQEYLLRLVQKYLPKNNTAEIRFGKCGCDNESEQYHAVVILNERGGQRGYIRLFELPDGRYILEYSGGANYKRTTEQELEDKVEYAVGWITNFGRN